MPSLRDGDYRLIGAIQGSRQERWYRQCLNARSPQSADASFRLSCDCPSWTANQRGDRSCKHTDVTAGLLAHRPLRDARPVAGPALPIDIVRAMQPLLQGIQGRWRIEECAAPIGRTAYRFVLLEVVTPDGPEASAFVALAQRHEPHAQDIAAAVASWAGWAVAAEIARSSGFGQAGAPPDHFYRFRSARAPAGAAGPRGVRDLLTIGDRADRGDGLSPQQRAEQTLRLFLGPLYADLQRQGFLDVPSRAHRGRVYRLRIDPARRYDRRVRVFENNCYVRDLCIVRQDRMTPVQDGFLTIFMGLLSDEQHVLRVVGRHNIFAPNSDGPEIEADPAIWTPRAA